MKENDNLINQVCDKRCKDTEDIASKIEADIKSNLEKSKYKQQISKLENDIDD